MKLVRTLWTVALIISFAAQAKSENFEWKITQKKDPFEEITQVDAELEGNGIAGPWLRLRCRNGKTSVYTLIAGANLPIKTVIRGKLRINGGEIREGDWTVLNAPLGPGLQVVYSQLTRKTFAMFQDLNGVAVRLQDKERNQEWTTVFSVPSGSANLKPVYEACPIDSMSE